MLDRNYLQRVGETLFGDAWKTSLAQRMGISDRYLRMLLKGERPIPLRFIDELELLCEQRMRRMERLHADLRKLRFGGAA